MKLLKVDGGKRVRKRKRKRKRIWEERKRALNSMLGELRRITAIRRWSRFTRPSLRRGRLFVEEQRQL